MVRTVSALVCLLVLSEFSVDASGWPIPAGAIGMVILAGWFWRSGTCDTDCGRLFEAITPHVPLLFVPAAVGVIAELSIVSQFWGYFAFAIVFGTAAALLATGLVASLAITFLNRRRT